MERYIPKPKPSAEDIIGKAIADLFVEIFRYAFYCSLLIGCILVVLKLINVTDLGWLQISMFFWGVPAASIVFFIGLLLFIFLLPIIVKVLILIIGFLIWLFLLPYEAYKAIKRRITV